MPGSSLSWQQKKKKEKKKEIKKSYQLLFGETSQTVWKYRLITYITKLDREKGVEKQQRERGLILNRQVLVTTHFNAHILCLARLCILLVINHLVLVALLIHYKPLYVWLIKNHKTMVNFSSIKKKHSIYY